MKLKRLLGKLEKVLSADERKRAVKRAAIKKVLAALKKKERALANEVARAHSATHARSAEQKRRIARAQRHKGVQALKALKSNKR